MRFLLSLLLVSALSISACKKSEDSQKSSSSDDKVVKGDNDRNKKSGDDDIGDDEACTISFERASTNKDNAFKAKCPADCAPGSLYGTGWHTTDSSVCTAAVHSGAIKASKGGTITLKAHKGLNAYKGTKANGVTSSDWGSFGASFSVGDAVDGNGTAKKGEAEKVDCHASVDTLGHKHDDSFTAICPPGCKQGGSVYGTDVYTTDSALCRAAVLQGLITDDDGGKITVKIGDGKKSYSGSRKNGVKSEDYGPSDASFTLQ